MSYPRGSGVPHPRERCVICGQLRDDCPSHLWADMRGELNDLPGKTGDVIDGLLGGDLP